MSIFYRLKKIITSEINHRLHKNLDTNYSQSYSNFHSKEESNLKHPQDTQVKQDLALFNLKPPSSLKEVKIKRNQILKQYHPDRFNNNPEKTLMAKELIQEYNDAYKRLEVYFQSN